MIKLGEIRRGNSATRKFAEIPEYRADMWDKQIVEDSKSGKLDKLFADAEADIAAGKVRPL